MNTVHSFHADRSTCRPSPWPRLVAVEMRRALHRRLVWSMIALAVVLSAFAGVVVFLTSTDPAALATDPGHPAHMASWWPGTDGDGYLLTAALFLVVGAVICAASVAGAEWRAGTITTILTWVPSRRRLHLARTASAALLAFAIAIVLEVLFLAAAVPAVIAHGTTAGTGAAWWMGLALAVVRIAAITGLVAVVAVSIATLGRNTSAALIVIAAWALVVERVVAGLRPQWARFLIGENVAIVVPWKALSTAEFGRPPLVALVALVGYGAVIVAAATASFARRDVAAT